MSHWSTSGRDSILPIEYFVITRPKIKATKRAIVYIHGRGDDATSWQGVPQRAQIINALADMGHTIVSCEYGGMYTWGNNQQQSAITTAVNYALSLDGVLPGSVILMGQSMGGLGAFIWARKHRAMVTAVIGIIPVCDLTDCHDNRGFSSDIDAAYGGTYTEAAWGAVSNPQTFAAAGDLTNTPIQIWYGTSDAIAIPSLTASFGASVGASCQLNPLTGGHADSTVGEVDVTSIATFIAAAESVTPVVPTLPSIPAKSAHRYWSLNITSSAGNILRVSNFRLLVGSTAYPTVNMTSDTAPSPLVSSASSLLSSGFEAWHAFDSDLSDASRWAGSSGVPAARLNIDLGSGNAILPTAVQIAQDASSDTNYITSFNIEGSDTGAFTGEQEIFGTFVGLLRWPPSTNRTFTLVVDQ